MVSVNKKFNEQFMISIHRQADTSSLYTKHSLYQIGTVKFTMGALAQ